MRRRNRCHLCLEALPGMKPQGFPAGEGKYSIGSYRICEVHMARIYAIARRAGIVTTEGILREYGLSLYRLEQSA